MSTASKRKTKVNKALDKALSASPRETKVHLSLRLDSDLYMELQRRAEAGEANGKYQTLLNRILRKALLEDKSGESLLELTNKPTISTNELFQFLKFKSSAVQKPKKR